MQGFGVTSYGAAFADAYADLYPDPDPSSAVIQTLRELAGGGPALELGVGNGRIARPLSAAGVPVTGIDVSTEMLDECRRRDPEGAVRLVAADFTTPPEDLGPFRLVYCVFNTFLMLADADLQRRCLSTARTLLTPDGVLVLETFRPDLRYLAGEQFVRVKSMTASEVILQVSLHRPAEQLVESQDVVIGAGRVTLRPTRVRYVWPAELDGMATASGLVLASRWAGWDRSPAAAGASNLVSVYRRGEEGGA